MNKAFDKREAETAGDVPTADMSSLLLRGRKLLKWCGGHEFLSLKQMGPNAFL